MSSLYDFIQNGGAPAGSNANLEKLAERQLQKNKEMRKRAEDIRAGGRFMGKGFHAGLIEKVAEDLKNTGVDSVNPMSAAQTPSLPSIELPTNAPGPNDTLRTVRPGGGEQHNNDLFMEKLDEKRKKEGLADIANGGISTLTGSPFGTSAQFGLNHNK